MYFGHASNDFSIHVVHLLFTRAVDQHISHGVVLAISRVSEYCTPVSDLPWERANHINPCDFHLAFTIK